MDCYQLAAQEKAPVPYTTAGSVRNLSRYMRGALLDVTSICLYLVISNAGVLYAYTAAHNPLFLVL